ncbi:MAG: (5-formylfuran-3-yl)methyl phosphate synthase [Fuerstiella sp.]|nr:(5-formylfuran-3-yl)methyl phosphate synthase [Fuerstiella sp.]
MTIQLLVSVRDAAEAVIAADSGADIVDVKEPEFGSLGFAGAATIRDIIDAVDGRIPVSAALGECLDWPGANGTISDLRLNGTEQPLAYVKLGLSGLFPEAAGDAWADVWTGLRREFDSFVLTRMCGGSGDVVRTDGVVTAAVPIPVQRRQPGHGWVAVAYADHERAGAPPWPEVLSAAVSSGCAFLLIDTHGKDRSSTLDWLPESELINVRQQCQRSQLSFALAGQLNQTHLPAVRRIQPDVFAVRGAVCDGLDRCSTISGRKVLTLRTALQ